MAARMTWRGPIRPWATRQWTDVRLKSTQSSGTRQQRVSDYEHCMRLVKETDFNAYVATLVMPKQVLRPAFALRAFCIELLSIGKHRSNESASISQMKLQFWKDQIAKIYEFTSKPPEIATEGDKKMRLKLFEPVSNELAMAIQTHGLTKSWFNRLVDGRRLFFSVQQFKTMDELEKCADSSMSTSYYILFQCMGIKNVDCDHAASHLGKAEMLTGIARNLLKPASQTIHYLPLETLAKHGIAQQDLLNSNQRVIKAKQQQIKDMVFEICSRANQHLKSARSLDAKIPGPAKTVFASAVQLEVILKEMERLDFDLTNPKLASDFRVKIIYKTMLSKLRNKY